MVLRTVTATRMQPSTKCTQAKHTRYSRQLKSKILTASIRQKTAQCLLVHGIHWNLSYYTLLVYVCIHITWVELYIQVTALKREYSRHLRFMQLCGCTTHQQRLQSELQFGLACWWHAALHQPPRASWPPLLTQTLHQTSRPCTAQSHTEHTVQYLWPTKSSASYEWTWRWNAPLTQCSCRLQFTSAPCFKRVSHALRLPL